MTELSDGITAETILEYRRFHDVGMMQARRMLQRENAHKIVDEAQTVEDLRRLLHALVDISFK